jgi:hypothetical protein
MLRLFISIPLAIAPSAALAAGGWEQAPLGFTVSFFAVVYLIGCIPAAGLGFVLGSFFRLQGSVWAVAALVAVPIGLIWIARGAEKVFELLPLLLALSLAFAPVIYLGWRIGRRDAVRNPRANAFLANGN